MKPPLPALLLGALLLADADAGADVLNLDRQLWDLRLAAGDIDGDGVAEVIVGGSAAIDAVSQPYLARSARVDAYESTGRLRVRSGELHVVDDVAVADVDGDGRGEILAVGERRWQLLSVSGTGLDVVADGTEPGLVWRVAAADVDGDGRHEVARVVLHRRDDGDVPATVVELLRLGPHRGSYRVLDSWRTEGHVGDLCFAGPPGQVELFVETGAEEVGGLLRRFRVEQDRLVERSATLVDGQRLRLLSLSAIETDGGTALSLTDVSGAIRLLRVLPTRLAPANRMATGGAGAVFLSTRGQPHLLVAPRRGGGLRWLSDLPF